RGEEREEDVAGETQPVRFEFEHADPGLPERLPVLHHDREDRAELDHDVEHRPLRGVVAEQLRGENQVASGGDRDELGQALDDAEQVGGAGQSYAYPLLAWRAAKSTARPNFRHMWTRSSGRR